MYAERRGMYSRALEQNPAADCFKNVKPGLAGCEQGEAHTVHLTKLRNRTSLDLHWPLLRFHPHQSSLLIKIRTKAAPLPLLPHESALHRARVDVTQLLDLLLLGPHVCPHTEIVKALLPDRRGV